MNTSHAILMPNQEIKISPEIREIICCPLDKTALTGWETNNLLCKNGHSYPIVEGVPVLTLKNGKKGYWGIKWDPNLKTNGIDPFVAQVIGATGGYLYQPMVGQLNRYPIPKFGYKSSANETLLDLGCNWGRWCFSAEREGFTVIGIDPHLDAVLAAYRVAAQLGVRATFIAADARFLPFKDSSIDRIFSYSVLQHFAVDDLKITLHEVSRCLKKGGAMHTQMANLLGVRSLYHLMRRKFRPATNFDVRYWSPWKLIALFNQHIGKTSIYVDGFFSVNLQSTDLDLMPARIQLIAKVSNVLKATANAFHPLTWIADSLMINSRKTQ